MSSIFTNFMNRSYKSELCKFILAVFLFASVSGRVTGAGIGTSSAKNAFAKFTSKIRNSSKDDDKRWLFDVTGILDLKIKPFFGIAGIGSYSIRFDGPNAISFGGGVLFKLLLLKLYGFAGITREKDGDVSYCSPFIGTSLVVSATNIISIIGAFKYNFRKTFGKNSVKFDNGGWQVTLGVGFGFNVAIVGANAYLSIGKCRLHSISSVSPQKLYEMQQHTQS